MQEGGFPSSPRKLDPASRTTRLARHLVCRFYVVPATTYAGERTIPRVAPLATPSRPGARQHLRTPRSFGGADRDGPSTNKPTCDHHGHPGALVPVTARGRLNRQRWSLPNSFSHTRKSRSGGDVRIHLQIRGLLCDETANTAPELRAVFAFEHESNDLRSDCPHSRSRPGHPRPYERATTDRPWRSTPG